MIKFTTTIKRFAKQGEKTGWTYIEVPEKIAALLNPGVKKAFRVKGKLDEFAIKGVALIPMGGGAFIMAMNAAIRKGTGKRLGATITLQLELDKEKFKPPSDFIDCLKDEPAAYEFFNTLPDGHKRYFVTWIGTAKTEATKAKRIAMTVNAMAKHWDFGLMLRTAKKERDALSG